MEILTAYETDIGITKNMNQDGLLIKIASTIRGNIALLCVCDGMGGLSQGEMASTHMIYEMAKWFDHRLPIILKEKDIELLIKKELLELMEKGNRDLSRYGKKNGFYLGTTCTAMLIFEEVYYVLHVGDSRVYEIFDNVKQITHDQTVLAREIALGRVLPQDAKNDARESVLLQCIGASKIVEPEFIVRKTRKETVYMLCTDGFRHKITDREFLDGFHPKHMTNERVMQKQCEYFIELNKSRMEKDNITVILAKII